MARYDASINLLVSGQQKVEKLLSSIERFQGAVDSLRSTPIELNIGNVSKQLGQNEKQISGASKKINSLYQERLGIIERIGKLNQTIAEKDKILESGASLSKKRQAAKVLENALNTQIDLQNKLNNSIDQSQKLSQARSKIVENQESLRSLRQQIGYAKTLASSYLEYGDARKYAEGRGFLPKGDLVKNETSIAAIKQQAATFELLANNARIASKEFNRFAIASEVASLKAGRAQQEKLGVLAEAFSPAGQIGIKPRFSKEELRGARGAVDSLIASYGGVVKSEAALSSYISRLQSLQSLVPYLSEEYGKLELAIAEVSMEMDSLQKQTKFLGAVSKIQPQAGPASLLPSESVKSADEKAKYYKKINSYQDRLLGVEERISQANLNTLQQTELRARVDKALGLLAENRLDDAKKETIEIERQRMSLERMNRAQKPLTFGALGTGFSPISGELPGGVTIAGSPAAKIAEAKANRESTQAAVALAQQKQKAVEQEAEELRKGTQAATALGKQKLKALEDQANLLREETRNAVALAQQKMREEEKAIADAWKMRGGPELPPGFTEAGRIQQRGGTYRTGEFSPVDGKKRLENIKASGAILEQNLINLERKGIDVTTEREKLQKALNAAKEDGFDISLKTLDALDGQLTSARNFIRLQNTIRAGEAKGSKAAGSGLEAALKSLQEARGAGKAFLGGASPAEAIDKIVREFNTGKTVIGNAGQNAASTFVDNIKGAAGSAASAGKTFASSAAKAILKVFGIASPSRFMIELVKNLADTYVNQMEKEYPRIKAATAKAFGGQTLLRDVKKLRATNKGFEEYGRPSTGFKPFPLGAGTAGATSEFNDLINSFKRQIAELTTQPGIYGNLLNALPNSRITTDLAAAANRRAAASEIPSFMSTQRMLGPGELERFITAKFAEYLKDIKIPNPWVGAIGDYKEFIAKVVGETNKLRVPSFSGTRALPQGQIAGLLPAAEDSISNKFEDRIRQAFERSAQRGAAVFAEDATRRFGAGVAAIGSGVIPPNVPPSVPPGSGGGAGAGGGGAAQEGQRLLTLADAQINQASINELEGLAQGLNQFRNALNPAIEGFDLLDNQLRETINNINDVLESRAPGTDPLMRRFPGRRGRAISEGLIGGAFPLLFGQGVGASVGGGLGGAAGALVGGGLGFGLSLAGTAIGAELDKAVIAAGQLNSAFLTAAGSYSEIRKQGIQFTAELENQVNLLKQSGDFAAAAQLERGVVQGATGDINAVATEGVAAAGAVLSATWNDTYKSIQTTLGILASPFLFALNALLTPVKALFQGFNAIASLIANIPGVREVFAGWNEQAYKTTQEYQDQLAEIQKQINEAGKLNAIREEGLVYLRASLGLGRAEAEIINQTAEAAKRRAENQKEIEKIRTDNPSRTAEQRDKINRLVYEQQRKFLAEEKAIAIANAQEVYQEAVELNRSLSRQRIDNELRYRDLIVSRIREQRDLDLENSRKAQDILLEAAQKRLTIEEKINQQKLEASRIATQSLQIDRGLGAIGKPVAQGVNEFSKAVDEYGSRLKQIGQEYSQSQKAKQLELIQIQTQFERNKFDLAVRVSRINIDTQKQVASINREINRQNEDVSRKQLARKLQANLEDIKYQDRLARASYELNKAGMMSALQKPSGPDLAAAQLYKENMDYAYNTVTQFAPIIADLQGLVSRVSSLKTSLPEIGNVPSLSYDTSGIDKAQADLIAATKSGNDFKSLVRAVINENKNLGNQLSTTLSGAIQQFDQIIQKSQNDYDIRKRTVQLIQQGINPAIVEQIASLDQVYETQKNIINSGIEDIEARLASKQALLEEAEALSDTINSRKDINSEEYKALQIQLDIVNAKILGNAALEEELKKLRERAKLLDPNYKEARKSITDSAEPIRGEKISASYQRAKETLKDLATWENVAVTGAEAIGDAFGNAFKEITTGTASAQEILAGFFQNIADSFADMAAKMISNLVMLSLYENILGPMFGLNLGGAVPALAANGAAFSNGIKPFAMGGIVDSPTLFKFANGGAMNTGVMGEAGPEAILPLSRGSNGKLGVSANGSGGGTTNVTVNVDASGSKVQGDDQKANQLGKAVSLAVQQELLKQKRPGGLLAQ